MKLVLDLSNPILIKLFKRNYSMDISWKPETLIQKADTGLCFHFMLVTSTCAMALCWWWCFCVPNNLMVITIYFFVQASTVYKIKFQNALWQQPISNSHKPVVCPFIRPSICFFLRPSSNITFGPKAAGLRRS